MTQTLLHREIRSLVVDMVPGDRLETEHREQALRWMDGTDDLFRRLKPRTPDPHLVSYFSLVDHDTANVLLVDHVKAEWWLPPGGHVEPGEHPVATVRREVEEELGIPADFSPLTGERPLFVSVTATRSPIDQHTDVSLWFVLSGRVGQTLSPDPSEFYGVRWWTRAELAAADPGRFDPHLTRMLAKFDRASGTPFAQRGDQPSSPTTRLAMSGATTARCLRIRCPTTKPPAVLSTRTDTSTTINRIVVDSRSLTGEDQGRVLCAFRVQLGTRVDQPELTPLGHLDRGSVSVVDLESQAGHSNVAKGPAGDQPHGTRRKALAAAGGKHAGRRELRRRHRGTAG